MTTTRPRRSKQNQYNSLKALVAVGSLAATLVGAKMLAVQDEGQIVAETAVSPTTPNTVTTNTVTTNTNTATTSTDPLPMPPNQSSNGTVTLNLQPIPKAASPVIQPAAQPVARAKSSG